MGHKAISLCHTDDMGLPRIIAICGARRSGKGVLADHLCRAHGYVHMQFSQPLKDAVGLLFGFSPTQMESDAKDAEDERWRVAPRALLQWFGTDVMQRDLQRVMPGVGRTFWAERLVASMASFPVDTKFVISDMRFLHEAAVLTRQANKHGDDCLFIRVQRHHLPHTILDDHESEREFARICVNVELTNDGCISDLLASLDKELLHGSTACSTQNHSR